MKISEQYKREVRIILRSILKDIRQIEVNFFFNIFFAASVKVSSQKLA